MSAMIEIRDVPDDLRRILEQRATRAGQTLSAYLLAELSDIASRPTLDELRRRLASRTPVASSVDAVDILREARERP